MWLESIASLGCKMGRLVPFETGVRERRRGHLAQLRQRRSISLETGGEPVDLRGLG